MAATAAMVGMADEAVKVEMVEAAAAVVVAVRLPAAAVAVAARSEAEGAVAVRVVARSEEMEGPGKAVVRTAETEDWMPLAAAAGILM